ncbi:MAG: hypothetical protein V1772_03410 [Chloroflexota bacterium]
MDRQPLRQIAAIITEYRPLSHADVIVGKFLRGFPCDDGLHPPRVRIASMYLDQTPENDTGVATAQAFGVPIYPTIEEALKLGGDSVAVDGVLLIGEHGDYPPNEVGQKMYPRHYFFESVANVLAAEGRSLPLFCDKHLSYHWPSALWMYEAAQRLRLPFMAGSSLPVCWRRPWLDYARGVPLEAAVGIGYGPLESYGFHALETVQCMVERRRGGETGVEQVRCLEGDAVWEWLSESPDRERLAMAATKAIRRTKGQWSRVRSAAPEPAAFVVRHLDGLETAVLMLDGFCQSFAFAALGAEGVSTCEFVLQSGGAHAHFSYLSRNVEEMFLTGLPSYPVERTLLTTGILAAAMQSRYEGHRWISTPHLRVCYEAVEAPPYRPTGPEPSGACLAPWPPEESAR